MNYSAICNQVLYVCANTRHRTGERLQDHWSLNQRCIGGKLHQLLISNICTKANRTLGLLRRTLFSCPQNVKETAYKGMVRPILEYGSSVWDPHPDKLQEELEKVQNRAARFVTRNYVYETGSMTGILGQLKWESLKKRRKDNRLILLYKGLKGKARILTDDLIPKTRRGRNQHSFAFQIPSASKDVYKYSFFPQTIRDCNALPESLISSSELSDDSVSKFTSLVRASDLFPPVTAPGEGLSIWRFTSKLFRFRFSLYRQLICFWKVLFLVLNKTFLLKGNYNHVETSRMFAY